MKNSLVGEGWRKLKGRILIMKEDYTLYSELKIFQQRCHSTDKY